MVQRYRETVIPHKRPNTIAAQRPQLTFWASHLGHLRVSDVTLPIIAEKRDLLAKTFEPSTVNRYLALLSKHGIQELDYVIVSHYDADHIGGIVTGILSTHGRSFVLGVDQEPGSPGDDNGDGSADWLDNSRTTPDPEELGSGDDIRVLNWVDCGSSSVPSSQTYKKYIEMASNMGVRTSLSL